MSTTLDTADAAAPARAADVSPLYRAIWRWHFYAGLIAVPFMILLAVTGSIYLFHNEIDRTVFAYRHIVTPSATPLAPSAIVEKALAANPGAKALSYRDPPAADRSAIVKITSADGPTFVYVDPGSGKVLDQVARRLEFHQVTRKIHSLEFFGMVPNRIIEAIGGFGLVLVVTGVYLWWPRNQTGGVYTVRGTPARRVWWRDLHAVTGAAGAIVIFFLAATGMPWTGFWGERFNDAAREAGLGFPALAWGDTPKIAPVYLPAGTAAPAAAPADAHAGHVMAPADAGGDHAGHGAAAAPAPKTGDVLEKPGWAVERADQPASKPVLAPSIGLDRAVKIVIDRGLMRGFEMALPQSETGVYTAAIYPADLAKERTIHLDQYSGAPIADISFADYGPIGKAVEWGVNVHMGQEWGLFNQLLMVAGCLALVVAAVSGTVMWWKRRPAGKVGVPPMPQDRRIYVVLWTIAVVFGALFPITGLAILIMIALDLALIRTVPALRAAFGRG